jgi:hypothetical protein
MGTPFYMAPEAVQGAEMTPLSDQYALGVVLRECVTGKNPFEGSNFAEVVKLITTAQYPALSELSPRLSKRFVAIVDRAMSTDPKNRFDDMRAMGRQLLLLAGQRTRITWGLTFGQEGRGPLPLATLERPAVPAQLPPPHPRKKRATAMLVAGVAVLSASLTSLFLTPEGDERTAAEMPAAGRDERTVVMNNNPEGASPPLQGSTVSQPPPALDSERGATKKVAAAEDDGDDDVNDARESARSAAVSEALQPTPRKPQRVVRREPERKTAARPAPRRRPQAPAQPQRPSDDVEDWEVNVVSRVPANSKERFEVGSNNAPILD